MAEEIREQSQEENEKTPSMEDFKDEIETSLAKNRKGIKNSLKWEKVKELSDNKCEVEIEIQEAVKGGVTGRLEGLRAFIPMSKLSLGFVREEDMKDFVGKKVKASIITCDPDNNKLVLSVRDQLKAERNREKKEKAAEIQIGSVFTGHVETIRDYGAFVRLENDLSGLIHVSQISNKRVKTPGDVLKEGQEVRVQVIDVKDGRISLSMKSLEENLKVQREKKERDDFNKNFKGDGAVMSSLGAIMKKNGINF